MFIPDNYGFKRQYVCGGAGIFDSIASFVSKLFASNAARQIASIALDVGKNSAKGVEKKTKKTVDVGKSLKTLG